MVLESGSVVAKTLMENMGWREGQGLGKDGQGRTVAVQPRKKIDNSGIGSRQSSQNWLASSASYDAILAKLNIVYQAPGSAATRKRKAESELDENPRKKAKKEKSRKRKERKEQKEENKPVARHVTYTKRLKSKHVAGFSEQDKAEIFGGEERSNITPLTPASVLGIEVNSPPSTSIKLEGGFTEQTQVNIYNKVMDGQVKGRKGLGLVKMTKSVRREAAQRDAQLLKHGSYLARKFVSAGTLSDYVVKAVEEHKDIIPRTTKNIKAKLVDEDKDKRNLTKQERKERKRLRRERKAKRASQESN